MPELSVITINFNDAAGLERTIGSLGIQTYRDFELIVIDGGSTDGSVDVIKKNEGLIRYWVSEKDKGIYNAQNKGIAQTKGNYCLFLNSGDSLINEHVLQKVFANKPSADIVYGDMQIDWGNGKITHGKMPDTITKEHMILDTLWHPVSFIKRTLFEKYGTYNEEYKMVADYDFFFKTIIANNVSTQHVNLEISLYNVNGFSSKPEFKAIEKEERARVQRSYLKDSLVSVIVPCYNYGNVLPEALDSVLAQSYSNWECIIIDNASTDNTKEVAVKYTQKDNRFQYLFVERKGVSAARNEGIRQSEGKYILPLDADDKIAPTYIEKAVVILQKQAAVKIVYCKASLFGNSKGKWKLPPYSLKHMLIENLIFCTALFRRSDFDQTSGYNEKMLTGFEDWDFWLSMLEKGGDVYRIPEVLFYYRIRAGSRNSSLDVEKQKALRAEIYESHKALYERELSSSDLIFDNYQLKNNYHSLSSSKEYNAGKKMLAPLRFLKDLLKRNK